MTNITAALQLLSSLSGFVPVNQLAAAGSLDLADELAARGLVSFREIAGQTYAEVSPSGRAVLAAAQAAAVAVLADALAPSLVLAA